MNVHLETRINAPADAVWHELGTRFAEIDDWSTFVKSSRAMDASEVPADLTVAPTAPVPGRETTTKVTLREVLTDYSDDERSLEFIGLGLPPIITYASNVQSVRDHGDGTSSVVFDVTMDFKGPFSVLGGVMKKRMEKQFAEVQGDLKVHVEAN